MKVWNNGRMGGWNGKGVSIFCSQPPARFRLAITMHTLSTLSTLSVPDIRAGQSDVVPGTNPSQLSLTLRGVWSFGCLSGDIGSQYYSRV
jgi:hypothetical protein